MWHARRSALVRLLAIKAQLDGGRRWTLYALAERFGVHHRTIRRDLETLEAAGVPLTNDDAGPGRGKRGEWWLCQ